MTPTVTVVIPARNEAADIERALEALCAQDHPLGDIEVLVVDGGSWDETRDIAKRVLDGRGFHRIAVLENDVGSTPANLNQGLSEARGSILCRVDARSVVPTTYVQRCQEILQDRDDVVVVGGSQVAWPRTTDTWAVGIARALNNRWGTGLARYRRSDVTGPTDTVYLGAFRTEELRDAGGWDERLPTNQDFELNRRMARRGLIWFVGDLTVRYQPRETIGALVSQYVRFGRAKVSYWCLLGDRPRPRQIGLLAAPATIAGCSCWWIARGRAGRRLAFLAAATGLGAFVIDEAGHHGETATLAQRATAAVSMAGIGGGWLLGVVTGGVRLLRHAPARSS